MSTIASPREPRMRRMPSSAQTPTSSSRPSLDTPRSVSSSPSRGPTTTSAAASASTAVASAATSGAVSPVPGGAPGSAGAVRRNRAALREYYNLKNTTPSTPTTSATPATPVVEVTDAGHADATSAAAANSEVPASAMDAADFDADAYVALLLRDSGLVDLLRVYTRVLGETRALDAEKKSLVYDNYSRLITATETIRKMRANMDPLHPMASTLDPAIAHIYREATALRDAMRAVRPDPASPDAQQAAAADAAAVHTRRLAATVLQTPARLRRLVAAGRTDDAARAWDRPRRLLLTWREQGLGGADVVSCLADGDAALRGEPAPPGWMPGTAAPC